MKDKEGGREGGRGKTSEDDLHVLYICTWFCIIRQDKEKAFLYKLIETFFIILEQLPDTGTYCTCTYPLS